MTRIITPILTFLLSAAAALAPATRQRTAQGSFAQVQPFDENTQLPAERIVRQPMARAEPTPSLGNVARLDTLARPGLRANEPTEFHIYTQPGGDSAGAIKFQARAPAGARRRLNPERDYQYNLVQMAASGFNVSRARTVVMIPGYLNAGQVSWALEAKDLWLRTDGPEVNLVVVGWPASQTSYSQAVADTPLVARQVTIFLHYLAQLGGTSLRDQRFLDNLHLVGHSLGAHIAGFVGQDLGGRAGRITGLDPAGPSFDQYTQPDQLLNRNQAQLVEVLHTNAGQMKYVSAITGALATWFTGAARPASGESGSWLGIDKQLGHLDYYANNGRTQEGCSDPVHSCDHQRATELYVDRIRYELALRAAGRPDADRRLFALRARTYEAFQTGGQTVDQTGNSGLCPEVMQVETHLERAPGECAAPLLDFWTPLKELKGELRNSFNVNFNPNASAQSQPGYYFRTQRSRNSTPPAGHYEYLGDQYALKVYLDAGSSAWDSARCSLDATLRMASGQEVRVKASNLTGTETVLALPFAHPNGAQAHADLQALLPLLAPRGQEADQARAQPPQASEEEIGSLFQRVFPASLELSVNATQGAPGNEQATNCQVAIKELEVHPLLSVGDLDNVGVLSGVGAQASDGLLDFVSVSELDAQLASAPGQIVSSNSSEVASVVFKRVLVN